jgi:hypothetical protein
MRGTRGRRTAILLLPVAAGLVAVGMSRRGSAQTMEPYIWGISNMGETCAGWCYSGPHGGQYLCCGIYTKPAPSP